ncbi:MAG: RrF2 family transcriptional regulator [Lentisphaeria bacterium]
MKLSTKARYGVRILAAIAVESKSGRSSRGRVIAEQQNISEPYLEQIMIPLKTKGLVSTQRGCKGGYSLARRAEEITLLEIIELFEGRLNVVDCVGDGDCSRIERCPTFAIWNRLSKVLREEASQITLQDVVDNINKPQLEMNFVI